jgi:uncharacterized membrane protein
VLPRPWWKAILLILLAVFFVFAGVSHFTRTAFFVSIVPWWLPNPLAMVYISGVAEIAGGVGVLLPQTRRLAGWGLIALLIAVYPANVQMALETDKWAAAGTPPWALYFRLPLQFVALLWTWWVTKPVAPRAAQASAAGTA